MAIRKKRMSDVRVDENIDILSAAGTHYTYIYVIRKDCNSVYVGTSVLYWRVTTTVKYRCLTD